MKCGVITPIGPGHRALFEDRCLPSVERAVAYSKGPFEEITLYRMDDGEGRHSRSNRRNAAIRQAAEEGVDWLFFLDADDELTPNAFEAFGRVLAETPDIDAAFGLLCHFDEDGNPGLREGQPERLDSYGELIAWDPFVALETRRENIVSFGRGWCRRNHYCIAESVAYVNTMDYLALPMEHA